METRLKNLSVLCCRTIFQNIQECSEIFQIFKNIPKYSKIFQNIPKSSKIFQNIPKHSKIFQGITKHSKTLQNGTVWAYGPEPAGKFRFLELAGQVRQLKIDTERNIRNQIRNFSDIFPYMTTFVRNIF